ncbi:MAG: hypothetical protein M0Z52_07745 [Actinomycetota bacterium]|nr:hypothetical protein [Actinomycetota bacterium]MDA8175367.1 hypothetical protein [Nitrospiraceae bacterium]
MKALKIVIIMMLILGFAASVAFAAGNAANGKALFEGKSLSSSGMSCTMCHRGSLKPELHKFKTYEEAVNYMITTNLHGKALNPKGKRMADLVAYLKSLNAPKRRVITGC